MPRASLKCWDYFFFFFCHTPTLLKFSWQVHKESLQFKIDLNILVTYMMFIKQNTPQHRNTSTGS